jgi:hypothetical protein
MKSAAACRKVSRSAKVPWRNRKLIRKIRILEKCGRRKEFAATRIRMTRCAKMARRKGRSYEGPSVEQGRRKNNITKKLQEEPEEDGWIGTNGTRNRDFKEELRLVNERITRGIYRKFTGLEIAKRIARCTYYWAAKNQTKKKLHREEEPVMYT